jgi:hypothetical protein
MMIILLRFIDICIFKAGPADIPASGWLMKLSILCYFVISLLVNTFEHGLLANFLASVVEITFVLLAVKVLLQFRGLANRYLQTVTAIAGTSCCIGIVALPILGIFHFFAGAEDVRVTVLSVWLMILLTIWSLAVTSHIFEQSLAIKKGTAMVITIAYAIILIMVIRFVIIGVA